MSNVRVDMKRREVAFTLTGGKEIQGEVYLSLYSTSRMGEQRVDELLNEGSRFLPVRTGEGHLLVNVEHIMLARCGMEEEDHDLTMLGERRTVKIGTLLGTTVIAELYVSLPRGFQRVKDCLNQPQRFLTLFVPGHVLYVNRDFIVTVED